MSVSSWLHNLFGIHTPPQREDMEKTHREYRDVMHGSRNVQARSIQAARRSKRTSDRITETVKAQIVRQETAFDLRELEQGVLDRFRGTNQ